MKFGFRRRKASSINKKNIAERRDFIPIILNYLSGLFGLEIANINKFIKLGGELLFFYNSTMTVFRRFHKKNTNRCMK